MTPQSLIHCSSPDHFPRLAMMRDARGFWLSHRSSRVPYTYLDSGQRHTLMLALRKGQQGEATWGVSGEMGCCVEVGSVYGSHMLVMLCSCHTVSCDQGYTATQKFVVPKGYFVQCPTVLADVLCWETRRGGLSQALPGSNGSWGWGPIYPEFPLSYHC